MLQKPTFAIVIALSTLLAACSSSNNHTTSSTSSVINTPTNTIGAKKTGIQGNAIAITQNKAGNTITTGDTSDINKIVVAGQTIDFVPSGFSGNSIRIESSNMARIGAKQNHTAYGYYFQGTNSLPHLFSQGEVSNQVPNAGKATYVGGAVNVATSTDGKYIHITTPTANFDVDFSAKTLIGHINTANKIQLQGTINGNKFSGTKNDITTNGYFYGNQASELGGIYKNGNGTISGAYGAKKQ